MLRIDRSADGEEVCLTISGRIEAAHVAELQRLIDDETAGRSVVLDLGDVKLVDRDAVFTFSPVTVHAQSLDRASVRTA